MDRSATGNAVRRYDALLALIGCDWISVTDGQGPRRLEDPNDFVGLAIATASDRDMIWVICCGRSRFRSAGAGRAGPIVVNTAREISALLGVTVVGAIPTTRSAPAARDGAEPLHPFLIGYRWAIIVAAGVPAALSALHSVRRATHEARPSQHPQTSSGAR